MIPKKTLKKLYRLALYTSPLFGLYSVGYLLLFSKSVDIDFPIHQPALVKGNEWLIYTAPIVFVSLVSFVIWLVNIQLIRFQYQSGRISDKGRYIISYLIIFILISMLAYMGSEIRPIRSKFYNLIPFIASTANHTIVLVLINLTINRDKLAQLELDQAKLRVTNLIARQEQLRDQLHPHMLFNTLSNLQALIKVEPNIAEKYLVQLGRFLRSSIDSKGQELVSIADEIQVVQDYLDLQQLRFADAIIPDFKLSKQHLENGRLPVFSLQLLVENAIKHNGLSKQNPLNISIRSVDDCIEVANNIIEVGRLEEREGIGLSNLRERYQLQNMEAPEIKMDQEKKQFVVRIKVLS